jgi:hypothetical protein
VGLPCKGTDMPKYQSTAAKKARAAARQGAKYTAALREEQARSAWRSAFGVAWGPALQAAEEAFATMTSPAVPSCTGSSEQSGLQHVLASWDFTRLGQIVLSSEPLTTSMRTSGREVDKGRSSRSERPGVGRS